MKDEERRTAVKRDDLSIEIGARDKAEAASIVAIGDPAVLDYDMAELRNGLFVARGFDDRIGAYVVLEALRILARERPKAAVYGVATVQEEVGLRGAMASAFGVNPKVGIAVDVTHGTDSPSTESEKKHLGEISLGKGPVLARGANINPRLFEILVAAAEEKQIAYQIEPAPGPTGTDAAAIQVARAGVATALVSVPNRYMHSPCEVVHEADLAASAELIAAAVMRIGDDTNFVP
jgi:endoglucanase